MKRLILFFLLCIPTIYECHAFFDRDMHVLNMQNGLADNTVLSIYKDRDGFMWFGTTNGFSRYDGRNMKSFTLAKQNLNVSEIKELSPSCLGILANGVLHCFDRKTERSVPMVIDSKTDDPLRASSMLLDKAKNCWIISKGSLIQYQVTEIENKEGRLIGISLRKKREFTKLIAGTEQFSQFTMVNADTEFCLVTNRARLLFLSPQSPEKVKVVSLLNGQAVAVNNVTESAGIVWVSTTMEGVLCYHIRSGKTEQINYEGPGRKNRLSHTDAFQVTKINNGRYMAVTWSGYTLLIPKKENPEEVATELYNNTASLLYRNMETRMLSAYYDPNGIIWVGTNGGGVIYSDLRSQFYNQYHQARHNEICGIEMDGDNYLWMATYHLGVMRSDKPFSFSESMTFSQMGSAEVRSKETVLCSLKDKAGTLWFGNKDGTITSYDRKTRQFTVHSLIDKERVNQSAIWALHIDREQRFWIGTENGVWWFNPHSGISRPIPIATQLKGKEELYVKAIQETPNGDIWIGSTNYGLCRIVMRDNERFTVRNGYESKKQLQSDDIRSMLVGKDGYIYIGYSNGLALFSPKTESIEHFYTTQDGLCSNFIGSLMEDGKGQIWLGTNSGVVRYSRHLHQFYNYYISGSNRSASFNNGYLFWGNNKSLTFFNPEEIENNQCFNEVRITELEIDNHPVTIGEVLHGQTVLQKGISFTNFLQLTHDNRDFAVTFNNLSYSIDRQKYIYRLRPYQEEWQIGEYRRTSFTSLPAGRYTLEIANIYLDGTNGKITTLDIEIKPHWAHSLLFRFILLFLVVAVVVYLWHYIKRRQKRLEHEMQMKHELALLSLEHQKEHQILLERENFFTSVAHELRTPLTLILSPLQELLKQTLPSSPIYTKLLTMYRNGSSLHALVDHFLYMQKIEAGMVKLRLCEADGVALAKDIVESFREIAEIRKISLEMHVTEPSCILWMDAEKIGSAIRNLLSNSLKYTPEGGGIKVEMGSINRDQKDFCRITVTDTGIGISSELKERLFASFITGDAQPSYSTKVGIGLRIVKNTIDLHHGLIEVDSTVGEGSSFTLLIPYGKAHFTADSYEVATDQSEMALLKEDVLLHDSLKQEVTELHEAKKKLLIIEDNPEMRMYIKSLFIHRYLILEAVDGEEGVNKTVAELPDCVISDVMMPRKDGFTCCREIRERQETAHIPILLLTAKAEDSDKLQGSQSGADDFVMKPFNPELLKTKVEQLILQRERLKRIYTKALMLRQDANSEEKEDVFMQKLVNVIEVNLSNTEFNVKILAEQLNMSQPTLYRKLKQHSDLAAVDIIRSVRVSKAASLIMEKKYSIQEVSEIVGFSDARTLRKHFTEQFGVSPSKYACENTQ